MKFKEGDIVACQWGYDEMAKIPLISLYEFGYDSPDGYVVYTIGDYNIQDSVVFKTDQVRIATESEKQLYSWGK